MKEQLRWGILSTGRIAGTAAAALRESRTADLVAVGSRSLQKAEKFGAKYDIPKRYGFYEDLLADPEVKAVYIATPHPFHALWSIRAAEAGKHILCEKPLTVNHGEAMAVLEAARKHDVFLTEAFAYRYHPQTRKLIELIRDGVIGKLTFIEADYCASIKKDPAWRIYNADLGGGAILDLGCYPLSMARLLAGSALGKPFADPLEIAGTGTIGDTEVDEHAVADLRFENEIFAQIACSLVARKDNALRLYGTEGSLFVKFPWWSSGGIEWRRPRKETETFEVETDFSLYVHEMDAVAAQIENRESREMSWNDSLGNMKALDVWRRKVGLVYPFEKPDSKSWPVFRPNLKRSSAAKMKYDRLPGLEKDLSRLVMGVDNQPDDIHAAVLFDDYFERGGNAFDCAAIYGGGKMEKRLGRWVRNRGVRDEVVILDKGGHTPFCWPALIDQSIPRSLERLKVDTIDLYMLHRDNPEVPVDEFIGLLNDHLKADHFQLFGASNWTMERIDEANRYASQNGLAGFSAVSNNFSLARMVNPVWSGCVASSDPPYRQWHCENQMPLLPWSSQARGFFTDRSGPALESDKQMVDAWYAEDNFERKKRALHLAREKGVLPINIALAYVLSQPFPTFPLIGPRSIEETRTSLPALDIPLSERERQWLNLEV